MKSARFAEILRLLATQEVEFIVVGMIAGVLAGAPVTTLDVDIVHRRSPDNVKRLLAVLNQLKARYRHDPRDLEPTSPNLMSPGHQLLTTVYGDLDCLGTIDDGKGYEDLLPSTRQLALSDGLLIRALDLPALNRDKASSRQAQRPRCHSGARGDPKRAASGQLNHFFEAPGPGRTLFTNAAYSSLSLG